MTPPAHWSTCAGAGSSFLYYTQPWWVFEGLVLCLCDCCPSASAMPGLYEMRDFPLHGESPLDLMVSEERARKQLGRVLGLSESPQSSIA